MRSPRVTWTQHSFQNIMNSKHDLGGNRSRKGQTKAFIDNVHSSPIADCTYQAIKCSTVTNSLISLRCSNHFRFLSTPSSDCFYRCAQGIKKFPKVTQPESGRAGLSPKLIGNCLSHHVSPQPKQEAELNINYQGQMIPKEYLHQFFSLKKKKCFSKP